MIDPVYTEEHKRVITEMEDLFMGNCVYLLL